MLGEWSRGFASLDPPSLRISFTDLAVLAYFGADLADFYITACFFGLVSFALEPPTGPDEPSPR